jgi:hypothetical protein|tara:strand:- start:366 stop:728 length:363 start_codon:yes stop_codon:yes gene_type:complete
MTITLPAGLEAIATRADGSLKLTFGTPELDGNKCAELFDYRRKEVLLLLSTGDISDEQKNVIEQTTKELKDIRTKTHSQRLREALYLLHQQENSMLSFKEYYKQKMENLITMVLERLDDA